MNPNNWQIYGDHLIVMHIDEEKGAPFWDIFSIREYIPGTPHDDLKTVHRRRAFDAKRFNSVDDARASAQKGAYAWIDKLKAESLPQNNPS